MAVFDPFSGTKEHPEIVDPPTRKVIVPATLEVALKVAAVP